MKTNKTTHQGKELTKDETSKPHHGDNAPLPPTQKN
jgi:hypothetical protein